MSAEDFPILMSGPMVRALLREIEQPGTGKSQTRRLLTSREAKWLFRSAPPGSIWEKADFVPTERKRLWVREGFWQACSYPGTLPSGDCEPHSWTRGNLIHYAADGSPENTPNRHYPAGLRGKTISAPDPYAIWEKRPSLHMKRHHSRITLEVTNVRVQQLQDISENDARSEGILPHPHVADGWWAFGSESVYGASPRAAFRMLWGSIYTDPGQTWNDDPLVVAITFRPGLRNIDAIREVA